MLLASSTDTPSFFFHLFRCFLLGSCAFGSKDEFYFPVFQVVIKSKLKQQLKIMNVGVRKGLYIQVTQFDFFFICL